MPLFSLFRKNSCPGCGDALRTKCFVSDQETVCQACIATFGDDYASSVQNLRPPQPIDTDAYQESTARRDRFTPKNQAVYA